MQPINTVNPTIYLAIELSASTWLIAARLPESEKPHLHRIEGGDTAALFALISSLRARVARRLDAAIGVVCCFEAGRDGFWLHRLLTAHGIANYVLEPTSILINRRARRAKTDRLDAIGMLRVLAAYLRGDRQSCSMVRVPTPEDEDAKRIHRERENLVQEKLRIENRIEALLFTQGIRKRPSLRSWEHDLAVLRTGDGREMPRHLRAELDRLRRRLVTRPLARSSRCVASGVSARISRACSHVRYSIVHSTTVVRSRATWASPRCPTRAAVWTAIGALAGLGTRVQGRP